MKSLVYISSNLLRAFVSLHARSLVQILPEEKTRGNGKGLNFSGSLSGKTPSWFGTFLENHPTQPNLSQLSQLGQGEWMEKSSWVHSTGNSGFSRVHEDMARVVPNRNRSSK